jgi:predicted dehydrogenase
MISYNYTIGVVGCGYWGFNIIKTLQQIGIRNIFIYDKNIKNSLLINKTFNSAKIAKSFNELLINKNIKSLIFATPPSENFYLCQKALNNNKNIFVEKPVVKKKELLLKLHKLSVLKKLIFMSGYIYVYNDYINYIKKILKKKEIGKILYVQFLRKNLGPIRDKVNSYEDLGTHDLSILLFIFGDIFKIKTIRKHNILKRNISDISFLQLQTKKFKIDIESSFFFGIVGIPAKNLALFSGLSRSSLKSEKSSLKGGFETIKSNFFRSFLSLWAGTTSVLP